MEFFGLLALHDGSFETWPFDALTAATAEGAVGGVVVLAAVRLVAVNVEVSRLEWDAAGVADKTLLVIPAAEPTVPARDRLFAGHDQMRAASTHAFVWRREPSSRVKRRSHRSFGRRGRRTNHGEWWPPAWRVSRRMDR